MKKNPVFRWADPDKKFMVWDLEPNEVFSEEYAYYKLDMENFNFQQIDERRKLFVRENLQNFLDSCNIKISVDEFITLFNLQSYIHMMWPEHGKRRPYREDVFKACRRGKDNPMWLSDAFNRQIAACVECSLLAQMYLQHCGIESRICCGNTFFSQNPKIEFGGDAHAYLVVMLGGKQYIYDPANPMLDSRGVPSVPRIMSYAKIPFKGRRGFRDLLNMSVADGGGFAYLETSDIYNVGSCWLYGFESDDIDNHVWRRRSADGIKRQTPDQQGPQQIYGQGGRKM